MNSPSHPSPYKRNVGAALRAIGKLLRDPNDTAQVFRIMQSLNGPAALRNFARLMAIPGGPEQFERGVELAARYSDPAFVASFEPGTVGAAYRSFLQETGYTAAGLVEVSQIPGQAQKDREGAWMGRRVRDVHDIWHVLTGYKADEPLGEAALVAFSYAQLGGLGWALIAVAAALRSIRVSRTTRFARAIFEGYRRGRHAAWLIGEDFEALMHEPLEAARARLRLDPAVAYLQARSHLAALAPKGA